METAKLNNLQNLPQELQELYLQATPAFKDEAGKSLPTLKEISSKSREVDRISD